MVGRRVVGNAHFDGVLTMDFVFRRDRYSGDPLDFVFGGSDDATPGALPSTISGSSAAFTLASSGLTVYDNKNPKQVGISAAAPFQRASTL